MANQLRDRIPLLHQSSIRISCIPGFLIAKLLRELRVSVVKTPDLSGAMMHHPHTLPLVPNDVERCLGVDPGLVRTGYAVLESATKGHFLREGGVIRSTRGQSLASRIHEIGCGLREVIREFRPRALAIEQVFSLGKNPKSALLMAHARGAILMIAAEEKLPVIHFTPTQVKKLLTGSGKASKEQIQHAVRVELRLEAILEPHDVADASAIAICLHHHLRIAARQANQNLITTETRSTQGKNEDGERRMEDCECD